METQNNFKEYLPTKCHVVQGYTLKVLLKENFELKNKIEHLKNDFQNIIDQMLILQKFINNSDQKTKNKFEKIKMIVTILKRERECLIIKNKKYSRQIGDLTKEYQIVHRLLEWERRKRIRPTLILARDENKEFPYYEPATLRYFGKNNRLSYIKRPSYYLKNLSSTILHQKNKCKKYLRKKQRAKHVLLIKRKHTKYNSQKMITKGNSVPLMISPYGSQFGKFCLLPFIKSNSNQVQGNGIEYINESARSNESPRGNIHNSSNDLTAKEKNSKITKERSTYEINNVSKKYNRDIKGEIETRTIYVTRMMDPDGMKNTFNNNKDLHVNVMIQKYEKESKNETVKKTHIQQLTCFIRKLFDICTSSKKEDFYVFSKQVHVFLKIHSNKREQNISESESNEYMVQVLYKLMSLCIQYIKELVCNHEKRINQFEIKINNIVVFSNDIITRIKEKKKLLRKFNPLKEILIAIQNIVVECEYS